MVFYVEVIIYGDSLVPPRMRFGHVIDEGLVLFGREVVAREEIEHDLNLDQRISWRRIDQSARKKIYNVSKCTYRGTKKNPTPFILHVKYYYEDRPRGNGD